MKRKLNHYEYRDGWLYWADHHHTSRIGTRVGNKHPNGYWYYSNRLVHLLIWELHNGEIPCDYFVDHIDGDLDNCSISNLRLVTASQSSANRGPMKVRAYPKGVRKYGDKYRAYIDGEHLGTFATAEAALAARQAAESPYHRKEYFKDA